MRYLPFFALALVGTWLAFAATLPSRPLMPVFSAKSQWPLDVSPCQELAVPVVVHNLSPIAQAAGTLEYRLPPGFAFVSATGISLISATDPRRPRFSLPALGAGGTFSFQINVRSSCATVTMLPEGATSDTLALLAGSVSETIMADTFNFRHPALSAEVLPNWNYVGPPNSVFDRSKEFKNTGFGVIAHVYIIIKQAPPGVELLSTNGVQQGDTIVFSGADFGPDGLLTNGETFTLTQQFRVKGCTGGVWVMEYGWGCADGSICDSDNPPLSFSVTVSDPQPPKLTITKIGQFQTPKPCETSPVVFQFKNTSNTLAENIIAEMESSGGWDDCFPMNNFRIGSTALIASGSNPWELPLSQLTQDPDGPGGIGDYDDDGQFDDLPPGASVMITADVGLDPTCQAACSPFYERVLSASAKFTDACDNVQYAYLSGGSVATGVSLSNFTMTGSNPFEYAPGVVQNFVFSLEGFVSTGLAAVCPDATYTLYVVPPSVLKLHPNFQPTFNGTPTGWQMQNGTLVLHLPSISGTLALNFLPVCPDSIPPGPCPPPLTPPVFRVSARAEWSCGNGCDKVFIPLCFNSEPFVIACDQPQYDPTAHGLTIETFAIWRIMPGFLDNAMTLPVNLDLIPGVNRHLGIPGDVLRFRSFGLAKGVAGEIFDTATLRILYFAENMPAPYFEFLDAYLTFFDVETGQTFPCNGLFFVKEYKGSFHVWRLDLSPLFAPGGCFAAQGIHLTPGDQVTVEGRFRVTEDLPTNTPKIVDGLRAAFSFHYDGQVFQCRAETDTFAVLNPRFNTYVSVTQPFPALCQDLLVTHYYYQGSINYSLGDLFPLEIRPLCVYDTISAEVPAGYAFRTGSVRWYYRKGDGGGGAEEILVLPDPEIINLPNGGQHLVFARPPGLPVTDFFAGSNAIAKLSWQLYVTCPIASYANLKTNTSGHKFLATLDTLNLNALEYNSLPTIGGVEITSDLQNAIGGLPLWDIEFRNYGGYDLPNPFIEIETAGILLPVSAVDLTQPNSPVPLAIVPLGMGRFRIDLPPVAKYQTRIIRLEAEPTTCVTGSLKLRPGDACTGQPCVVNNTRILSFYPKNGGITLNMTGWPAMSAPLCSPVDAMLTVINPKPGHVFKLYVRLDMPPAGQVIVPNSCFLSYNGSTVPLPNPQLLPGGGKGWYFDFSQAPFGGNGLPGTASALPNSFSISFKFENTCDYVDGSRATYSAAWKNACDEPDKTNPFVGPLTKIIGAPTNINDFDIQLNLPATASFCSEIPFSVRIVNTGGDSSETGKIRVVLPKALKWLPSSYFPLHNAPTAPPAVTIFGSQTFLDVEMPAGIAPGDSIVFSLKITPDAAAASDSAGCVFLEKIAVQTLRKQAVACASAPGGACEVEFILIEKTASVVLEKPSVALSGAGSAAFPVWPDGEKRAVWFSVKNESASQIGVLPDDLSLPVEIWLDRNANGLPDHADTLLKIISVPLEGLFPGESRFVADTVFSSTAFACSGLLLLMSNDACFCHAADTLYLPPSPLYNAGPDTAGCSGQSIRIGTSPQLGHTYVWTAIKGQFDHPTVADPFYTLPGDVPPGGSRLEMLLLTTTRNNLSCVTTDTLWVEVRNPALSVAVENVKCHGGSDGSIVADFAGATMPVQYQWNPLSGGSSSAIEGLVTGVYNLTVTDGLGCKQVASFTVTEPDSLSIEVFPRHLACFGGHDGSILMKISGGTQPYKVNNLPASGSFFEKNSLSAGIHHFVITDAHDCLLETDVELTQPPAYAPEMEVVRWACFEQDNAILNFGNLPFGAQVMLDDKLPVGSSGHFEDVGGGEQILYLIDTVGCAFFFDFIVPERPRELGTAAPDTTIHYGDSVLVVATPHSDLSLGSTHIEWKGPANVVIACDTCSQTWVLPKQDSKITATFTTPEGCTWRDAANVKVLDPIYVPNVIKPGSTENSYITVYGRDWVVRSVRQFSIWDRYGELLFERHDFPPNLPELGWDGNFRRKTMNPAVFVYVVEVELYDGNVFRKAGDVTLLQ